MHSLSIFLWYLCLISTISAIIQFSFLLPDVSQASLTYAEAQMRIDDASKNDDITKSLRGLNKLAKILKRKRIENG